jgi:hypothetical protein
MKCDICNEEDVASKSHAVRMSDKEHHIKHFECANGHKWHFIYGARRFIPCDCSN